MTATTVVVTNWWAVVVPLIAFATVVVTLIALSIADKPKKGDHHG